ncbi:MAG: hypothetical protein ACI90V_005202 [Bacillariaceae sp.]|jgi:hypothetical protein
MYRDLDTDTAPCDDLLIIDDVSFSECPQVIERYTFTTSNFARIFHSQTLISTKLYIFSCAAAVP